MSDQEQAKAQDKEEAAKRPRHERSVRHVKAAATILRKEARRILRKFTGRIAPQPAEQIKTTLAEVERCQDAKDWEALAVATEELDELLHQHASFARKGALRETGENITVAVLVALALRSCVYEPFKIPSGSMMPTLRAGDHIFVNKFVYGIQIPLTNTVVGESLGEILRGDVIVFRYPINEEEDFIKRVMGLPGDTIRVDGAKVSIKRAGEQEFETLRHEKLSEPCYDESGTRTQPRCELFEETLDGRTHVVRYMTADGLSATRRHGEWEVPEGHLLVMGDNRNQSHDSLAWTRTVEAVSADGLLGIKDLRDLTAERLFTLQPPESAARQDPSQDHINYVADHRSPAHDLSLEVWRDPGLGVAATYAAATAAMGTPKVRGWAAIIDESPRYNQGPNHGAPRDRLLAAGAGIRELTLDRNDLSFVATLRLDDADAVMRLHCGVAACANEVEVVERLATILDGFAHNHAQDARQLLDGDRAHRYSHHGTSRSTEQFFDQAFVGPKAVKRVDPDPSATVRLRVWRQPDEGEAFVREASIQAIAEGGAEVAIAPDLGEDAALISHADRFAVVATDPGGVVFALECGRQRCASAAEVLSLAKEVASRAPEAARDRRLVANMLGETDLGAGWRAGPPGPEPDRYEYDRVRLDGTERTLPYSVSVWVWLRPSAGLAAATAELAAAIPGAKASDAVASGGQTGETSGSFVEIFSVPRSDVVIQVECRKGLCPEADVATTIARRIAQKALDRTNFVDPAADRPSPYVPRGNVKGRADRIWLPLRRFWLPIR